MNKQKPLLIFDLDGTLYELRGGSYSKSPLRKCVLRNAEKLIAARLSKSASEARQILREIQKKYGEQISIGLEKEFGIDRYDYFNTVWDIPARGIVKRFPQLAEMLEALRKEYRFALVSDAPRVWINNVLAELDIQSFFRRSIFSGEGNMRKGFGNAFRKVAKALKANPKDCISVGDQEETDILPAKALGMLSVLIHCNKRSRIADKTIPSIGELAKALEQLNTGGLL